MDITTVSIRVIMIHLAMVTAELPDCQDDQRIVFLAEPGNGSMQCGANGEAIFPCRYEGSTSLPQWIINSTVYSSQNSRLPPDHFYQNYMLTVTNTDLWQNTTYQCQVLYNSGPLFCAYRSSIGRLIIIKCTDLVIPSELSMFTDLTDFITATVNNHSESVIALTWVPTTVLPTSSQSMVFVNTSPDTNNLKMTSSESTGTVSTGKSPIPPNKTVPLSFIVSIAIGAACILVGMVLVTIPVGLWYYKSSKSDVPCLVRKINQENIYDEPSLPDPIYQEILESGKNNMEMMENYSYVARKDSIIVLQECSAYITSVHSMSSSANP